MLRRCTLGLVMVAALALAAGAPALRAQPAATCEDASYQSLDAPVRAYLCRPNSDAANLPAVVVLHGSDGATAALRPFTQGLAALGYVALYINYFSQTPPPGPQGFFRAPLATNRAFPTWLQNVADGTSFLQAQEGVDPARVGIIGFSLGTSVAALSAILDHRYRAFVEFYGVLPAAFVSRAGELPPTLILHGDADQIVDVAEAYVFRDALAAAGVPNEIQIYPGADHAFGGAAFVDATVRIRRFLGQYLAGDGTAEEGN